MKPEQRGLGKPAHPHIHTRTHAHTHTHTRTHTLSCSPFLNLQVTVVDSRAVAEVGILSEASHQQCVCVCVCVCVSVPLCLCLCVPLVSVHFTGGEQHENKRIKLKATARCAVWTGAQHGREGGWGLISWPLFGS